MLPELDPLVAPLVPLGFEWVPMPVVELVDGEVVLPLAPPAFGFVFIDRLLFPEPQG